MNDIDRLLRRGLLLEYITLGWNVVGTVVVIVAAIAAHSVALAGHCQSNRGGAQED